MKAFAKIPYFVLLFLILTLQSAHAAWISDVGDNHPNSSAVNLDIDNDFHLLFGGQSTRIFGDIGATGDTMLYVPDKGYTALYAANSTYMLTDANNTFKNATDVRKRNSSQGKLNLPSYVQGKDIVFAGLFWQGFLHENGISTTADVDAAVSGWNQATFKTPDGVEHAVTANTSLKDITNKTYHYAYKDDNSFHFHYSAYVDVTSWVQSTYTPTTNTFTLGNVLTTAGQDWGDNMYFSYGNGGDGTGTGTNDGNWGTAYMGYYSGWALVVVYAVDPSTAIANNVDYKTVSVYDGFDQFLIWDINQQLLIDIDINNFLTPKNGDVNSTLLLFGGAGDYGIGNDVLQIYNPDTTSFETISNTVNSSGHQFNSSYSDYGTHMTSKHIRNGVDLDLFDVSSHMGHSQTSTKIKFGVERQTGSADQIFPQVLAFSTKLYEPVFCYDYAYEQQKVYFTEDNDGTQDPRIVGDVIPGEDVNVTIFIRNLVDSDLEVKNMTVNVTDINTSQATYLSNSTYLTKTGELYPTHFSDGSLSVGTNFIDNIPVGDMSSNDYFYLYYGLDPITSTLDMPIKVKATYDLIVDGNTSVPYVLTVGANLKMCSSTNFKYTPDKGLFNIVSDTVNSLYPRPGGGYYNNLPTVVTQKADNYTVVSYDANDTNLNTLADANVTVHVELIDASAFHDTFASCQEPTSSISDKITVTFNSSDITSFTAQDIINHILTKNGTGYDGNAAKRFYQTARENAAFRISWNTDNNDSVITTITDSTNPNLYHLENFSEFANQNCVVPVTTDVETSPGNWVTKTYTQVPQACFNAGTSSASSMNDKELAACMQCIYGKNLHYVCSRDNFSIRPEAFIIQIDDQNQTNSSIQKDITTLTDSGSTGAVAHPLDLAAGYEYNIEINATNHYGNDASPGYTKTMNVTKADTAQYIWEPSSTLTSGACNDENNKSITMRFVDGAVDKNTSVTQVGEYRLNLKDTTWTTVDSNPSFMTHHDGDSYFLSSNIRDCTLNSSIVPLVVSLPAVPTALNGCNINSNHLNNHYEVLNGVLAIKYLQYNDYNVTFHPYKFEMNELFTVGDLNQTIDRKNYVYMNNLSDDEWQSVHVDNVIIARGYQGASLLSNYVDQCFSQPLQYEIGKTATESELIAYNFITHDINSSNAFIAGYDINGTIDANNTTESPLITLPANYWQKNQNGQIRIVTNLNYSRAKNVAINPEKIRFTNLDINDSANTFNADLVSNKIAEGNVSLPISTTVLHYYGRTIAPKIRVICKTKPCRTGNNITSANNIPELITYAIYCDGGNCNSSILPNDLPANQQQVGDSRWFKNTYHDFNLSLGTDGAIGTISEVATPSHVSEVSRSISAVNYETEAVIELSNTAAFPYDAVMQMQSSPWLIYNTSDANATANQFIIEFVSQGGWSGKYEDNTTTKTNESGITNRRIMW